MLKYTVNLTFFRHFAAFFLIEFFSFFTSSLLSCCFRVYVLRLQHFDKYIYTYLEQMKKRISREREWGRERTFILLQKLSFSCSVHWDVVVRESIKTEHFGSIKSEKKRENKMNQKKKKEIALSPSFSFLIMWRNMDNNIFNVVLRIIQMKARKRWSDGDEENIFEIKVSSPQSFLIYFVIVLYHGFILIENLYMCLHFQKPTA